MFFNMPFYNDVKRSKSSNTSRERKEFCEEFLEVVSIAVSSCMCFVVNTLYFPGIKLTFMFEYFVIIFDYAITSYRTSAYNKKLTQKS